jgi:hypothetical protein
MMTGCWSARPEGQEASKQREEPVASRLLAPPDGVLEPVNITKSTLPVGYWTTFDFSCYEYE